MNSVKDIFSIRDLENLSGIKAHTIRIWEKRYNVLSPMRTDSNIRLYDLANLQKLLNITLLHNHGYKISKISRVPEENIPEMVREIISRKSIPHHAINAFKMAMMNFDSKLFLTTYDQLLTQKSFKEVFYDVMLPLLDEIGLLWQSGTITPAHEHFITYLIKQKVLVNTEKLQAVESTRDDRFFALFLPLNEVHELGLMYLNYEILSHGYKSVYLGESVPVESLLEIKRFFSNVTYISYFTVEPSAENALDYVQDIAGRLLEEDSEFWVLGRNAMGLRNDPEVAGVKVFSSISELVTNL